jgi:hypothetical protein
MAALCRQTVTDCLVSKQSLANPQIFSLYCTCLEYDCKRRWLLNSSNACYRPPLWSSGQEFLATDPEALVRFPALPKKNVVGLERGPLSLVRTLEELLDRKVAAPV